MNPVIVDFGANWCGPCTMIAPHFERLAKEYSESALFLKVDVDDCEDIALTQGVSALPTFIFFKNKEIVDRIQGSQPIELEGKIKSYVSVRDENEEVKSESSQGTKSGESSTVRIQEKQKESNTLPVNIQEKQKKKSSKKPTCRNS